MMKLTSGQGHKVKGQDQICNDVKILVSTIYNEPMIGFCFMILCRGKQTLDLDDTYCDVY